MATAGLGHTWKRLEVRTVEGQCARMGVEMRGSRGGRGIRGPGRGRRARGRVQEAGLEAAAQVPSKGMGMVHRGGADRSGV